MQNSRIRMCRGGVGFGREDEEVQTRCAVYPSHPPHPYVAGEKYVGSMDGDETDEHGAWPPTNPHRSINLAPQAAWLGWLGCHVGSRFVPGRFSRLGDPESTGQWDWCSLDAIEAGLLA